MLTFLAFDSVPTIHPNPLSNPVSGSPGSHKNVFRITDNQKKSTHCIVELIRNFNVIQIGYELVFREHCINIDTIFVCN